MISNKNQHENLDKWFKLQQKIKQEITLNDIIIIINIEINLFNILTLNFQIFGIKKALVRAIYKDLLKFMWS